MDYIKEAKKLGFSNAAIMDTKKLVFKPEYRKFCEENQLDVTMRIQHVHLNAER